MKVIITGGTGFLGKYLIRALQAQGHQVTGLARTRAAAERLRELNADACEGDLSSRQKLKLPAADAIVHAAAHFRLAGPRAPFFRTNVEGTRALIKAGQKAGVSHFIAIGAAAVVMDDRGSPMLDADESAPTFPKSFSAYIASKARAERLVIDANASGFRTLVLRPPGIWGPGDAFSTALPALVKAGQFAFIARGEYPYVTCHAENVAEAACAALSARTGGRAFFINDSEPTTFRDFAVSLGAGVGIDISRARSVPYGVAWYGGRVMETLWSLAGAREDPPLSRTMVRLIGRPFTTNDDAARRELGYRGLKSRAEGLAELSAAHSGT